jgi:hypothetical protein
MKIQFDPIIFLKKLLQLLQIKKNVLHLQSEIRV